MKLKSLLVISLLVLMCSVGFAKTKPPITYTFGFENYNGSVLYCNYEVFTVAQQAKTFGAKYLAVGTDNTIDFCGGVQNGAIIGGTTTVPAAAGLGQTGKAFSYGDSLYDALYQTDTGLQWFVISETATSGSQGWIGFAAEAGYYLGANAGLLSAPPSKAGRPVSGPSIGMKNSIAKLKK